MPELNTKREQIAARLLQLINEVERRQLHGEFGVTFSAQNGKIHHWQTKQTISEK